MKDLRYHTKCVNRALLGVIAVFLSWSGGVFLSAQDPKTASLQSASDAQIFVKRYCAGCHSERLRRGGLSLANLDLSNVGPHAPVWEKVVTKMRTGLMPPVGARKPDSASYDGFRTWLTSELDRAAAEHPNPGPNPVFHRLNRNEYQNAVRDLLAVNVDVARFLPADDSSHGFDNMAGTLRVSSLLMERYLAAAKAISRLAVGSDTSFDSRTYYIGTEAERRVRTGEIPLGAEGGTEIRHYFPRDGEYDLTVSLQRTNRAGAMRTTAAQVDRQLEVAIDGIQVARFTVGKPERGAKGPPTFHVRVPVAAGEHHIAARFYKLPLDLVDGLREPLMSERGEGDIPGSSGSLPRLSSLVVAGPFGPGGPGDTRSRRALFVCEPANTAQEAACAETIVARLAYRAFRGTAADEDVRAVVESYADVRSGGGTFEDGIEFALRRLLVSPNFLFRIEADSSPLRGPRRVRDVELASRLSFFLWSSIPDEQLLAAAEQGQLRTRAGIEQQVRRMLADSRSRALTSNFASQWLELRGLAFYKPTEPLSFYYDEELRDSLQRETELFIDHVIRENRPVSELITARYTFLNKRLADHYGISGAQHPDLRRVDLPADSPRGGLLGHGSLLAITSHPDRTSPVLRGKWVLANLLGTPPPPPPPNVPALEDEKPGTKAPTLREQMSAHRANPVCASCHTLIDPAGFALEHFDAIGRWRDRDDSWNTIDSAAVLPDGSEVQGVEGLKAALVRKPERFATTVTERLLTYALGRGLEHYDAPSVRRIVSDSEKDGYQFQSLIVKVAQSYPFVTRHGAALGPAGAHDASGDSSGTAPRKAGAD